MKPTLDDIRASTYKPLSRPLFVYVNKESLARPEVKAFIEYYLTNVKSIVEHPKVKYVSLPDPINTTVMERFRQQKTGSVFEKAKPGESTNLAQLYGVK